MPDVMVKKRAWLVVRPALLELQDDAGRVIRRMIIGRGPCASDERARDLLDREAATLGYVVVGERRESRRWPRVVPIMASADAWSSPVLAGVK
jgi:hypothetical protein